MSFQVSSSDEEADDDFRERPPSSVKMFNIKIINFLLRQEPKESRCVSVCEGKSE